MSVLSIVFATLEMGVLAIICTIFAVQPWSNFKLSTPRLPRYIHRFKPLGGVRSEHDTDTPYIQQQYDIYSKK